MTRTGFPIEAFGNDGNAKARAKTGFPIGALGKDGKRGDDRGKGYTCVMDNIYPGFNVFKIAL